MKNINETIEKNIFILFVLLFFTFLPGCVEFARTAEESLPEEELSPGAEGEIGETMKLEEFLESRMTESRDDQDSVQKSLFMALADRLKESGQLEAIPFDSLVTQEDRTPGHGRGAVRELSLSSSSPYLEELSTMLGIAPLQVIEDYRCIAVTLLESSSLRPGVEGVYSNGTEVIIFMDSGEPRSDTASTADLCPWQVLVLIKKSDIGTQEILVPGFDSAPDESSEDCAYE